MDDRFRRELLRGGELATYGPLAISSTQAITGTHSLAVPVTVTDVKRMNCGYPRAAVLDRGGRRLDGQDHGVRVALRNCGGQPQPLEGGQSYALLYSSAMTVSPELALSTEADVTGGDSPWAQRAPADIFINFGVTGVPITHVGLLFCFLFPWKGTIYVDDFEVL